MSSRDGIFRAQSIMPSGSVTRDRKRWVRAKLDFDFKGFETLAIGLSSGIAERHSFKRSGKASPVKKNTGRILCWRGQLRGGR